MSVSIVVNYYNNAKALGSVIKHYRALVRAAKELTKTDDFFELVLVDDHSDEIVDKALFEGVPDVRVFRVTEDVAWNMSAARNIGALEARKRQILFKDVDHQLEVSELKQFIEASANLLPNTRMSPGRKRPIDKPRDGEVLKPSINCFLIHRQDFYRAGGYEEMFAGAYGQEDKFFRYCCRWNGIKEVEPTFNLTLRGGATGSLNRDKIRNEAMLDALVASHAPKARRAFQSAYEQIV